MKGADNFPLLSKADKKFVQQVTGVFLFYARAADSTMLTALSAIASEQAKPIENTMKKCIFLYYTASQEEAIRTYTKSDMVLAIHSDASYLFESKARSRAGGHWFMEGHEEIPANNGAVMNVSQIIKAVMSSAAKAEIGALFINLKLAVLARKMLEELGHMQPKTTMQTDNSTENGLPNSTLILNVMKSIDIQFHWMRCRDAQGSSDFTGDQEPRTGEITEQNTTRKYITRCSTRIY